MAEASDNIQGVATSFGERYMLQQALEAYNKCSQPRVKEILKKTITLHCLTLIKNGLGWYLQRDLVSREAAAEVD